MAIARYQMPDGRIARYEIPDGMSPEQAESHVMGMPAPERQDKYIQPHNVIMGGLSGAANIGASLMRPVDAALNATGLSDKTNVERRQDLKNFFNEQSDPESNWFKGGELASEIAGTAGAGGVVAKGLTRAAGAVPALTSVASRLAPAIESGGMYLPRPAATSVGEKLLNMGTRAAGGAIAGGTMAGMVNPDDALTGAAFGGALPGAVALAGGLGRGINKMIPRADARRQALARSAENMGIDIPADRLVNSKAIDAMAGSLNYVPMAGRAQTEEKMVSQMNRHLSKLIGENTDNVGQALENARSRLGGEFDRVLQNNTVKMTPQFKAALQQNMSDASQELTPDLLSVIQKNHAILDAVPVGANINGQAAYGLKRTLDNISKQNSPVSQHARNMRQSLMDALNESIGPQEAKLFQKTRQQYGRMAELEKMAGNVEGAEISAARLGNKRFKDKEMKDVSRVAATFIKPREGAHSQQQRVWGGLGIGGGLAALLGGVPAAVLTGGTMAGGRLANTMLNSDTMRAIATRAAPGGPNALMVALSDPALRSGLIAAGN